MDWREIVSLYCITASNKTSCNLAQRGETSLYQLSDLAFLFSSLLHVIYLFFFLSVVLSTILSVCRSFYHSVCLSFYLPVSQSDRQSLSHSLVLSFYCSVCPSITRSPCLSTHPSIYLSIRSSVHLSVWEVRVHSPLWWRWALPWWPVWHVPPPEQPAVDADTHKDTW